jgi:hypothetical protein
LTALITNAFPIRTLCWAVFNRGPVRGVVIIQASPIDPSGGLPKWSYLCLMKQVGIYLRVSTNGQTTENQRRELDAIAGRSGWRVVEVFEDNGISGAKGRDKRPAFDRMLKAVIVRKIDVVAAWSTDRIGRSLQHLVAFLAELQAVVASTAGRHDDA